MSENENTREPEVPAESAPEPPAPPTESVRRRSLLDRLFGR